MKIMPFVKRCPCCSSVNLITNKTESLLIGNEYKNLKDLKFKKKFTCRKCREKLGLFINESSNETKVFWLNSLNCDAVYYDRLTKLNNIKIKLSKNPNKKYHEVIKEIEEINNKIRMDKIKLKIKFKIQNKSIQDSYSN